MERVAGDIDQRAGACDNLALERTVDDLAGNIETRRAGGLDQTAVLELVRAVDDELIDRARRVYGSAGFIDDRYVGDVDGAGDRIVDVGQRRGIAVGVDHVAGAVAECDLALGGQSSAVEGRARRPVDRQLRVALNGQCAFVVDRALQLQVVAGRGGKGRRDCDGARIGRTVEHVVGVDEHPFARSYGGDCAALECVAGDIDQRAGASDNFAAERGVNDLARQIESSLSGRLDEAAILEFVAAVNNDLIGRTRRVYRSSGLVDDRHVGDVDGAGNRIVDVG